MNSHRASELHTFHADLHIHSALSPCAENLMTPENVVQKVLSLDIDIFSITDHNSWFNCVAFAEAAKQRDILFIPGIELQSAEEVHILGYFPDIGSLKVFYSTTVRPALMRGVKNDPQRFGNQFKMDLSGEVLGEEEAILSMPLNLSAEELVEHIHNYDGIAVAAHIDRGFSIISQLGFIPPQLRLDAVEIHDVTKIDSFRSTYLKDRPLNVISSSDSHYLDKMKRSDTKLKLPSRDIKSCFDCIKGEGVGDIIVEDRSKKGPRRGGRPSPVTDGRQKEGWKDLYS